MSNDPSKARPAQERPPPHQEPMHPGPGSHVEKAVRKAAHISAEDKRRVGEEASRIEDA